MYYNLKKSETFASLVPDHENYNYYVDEQLCKITYWSSRFVLKLS